MERECTAVRTFGYFPHNVLSTGKLVQNTFFDTAPMHSPGDILAFWFGSHDTDQAIAQAKSKVWWAKDAGTDLFILRQFEDEVRAAGRGERDEWSKEPASLLALILLTDQFPRNIYRGRAEAFAFDAAAQSYTQRGLEQGMDRAMRPIERVFFYLPLEHAESLELQNKSVSLFTSLAAQVLPTEMELFAGYARYALRHRDIIARFGRFPHRNVALGRTSTSEEAAFLLQPGSFF